LKSIVRRVVLRCDVEDCAEQFWLNASQSDMIESLAEACGWVCLGKRHYCREHHNEGMVQLGILQAAETTNKEADNA